MTASHRDGSSNFIVELIGYGDTEGKRTALKRDRPLQRRDPIDDLPQGHYLLAVIADGDWTITFKR